MDEVKAAIPAVVGGAVSYEALIVSFVHVMCNALLSVSVCTSEVVYIVIGAVVDVETAGGWEKGV